MIAKKLLLIMIPATLFSKSVDFDTALRLTLENSLEIKAKKLDIQSAKKGVEEAQSYSYGSFAFNETVSNTNHAGYVFGMKTASREATMSDFGFTTSNFQQLQSLMNSGQEIGGIEPTNLNHPDPRSNFETKLTYDIPLFVGYKLQHGESMAELQKMAKMAKLSHDKKYLGLKVLQAYNGAVIAKRFIALMQKGKAKAHSFIETATDMYQKRLTRIIDVKQAKMAYQSIDTKLKEAQSKFDIAIAYLRFLTADETITDVNELKLSICSVEVLPKLKTMALEHRDDLQWMEYNTQTMKKKIDFESSSDYPTIGAHVEYGFNDEGLAMGGDNDYYMVAVGLKYNIFDGGLSKVKQERARLEYLKTKNYQQLMQNGIALEVEKNFLDLQTKQKTFDEKVKTGTMSEEILEETIKIYKNNLNYRTNMMYLLMSLQNMMAAQADVIKSEYDKSIAAARLQLVLGRSLDQSMKEQ